MLKKGESKENLKDPVYLTFFAAFLFLSGTTLITLLAAISANKEDEAYLKKCIDFRNSGKYYRKRYLLLFYGLLVCR